LIRENEACGDSDYFTTASDKYECFTCSLNTLR
jgi:hypothetical protein